MNVAVIKYFLDDQGKRKRWGMWYISETRKRLTTFSDMIQIFQNPDRLPAHLLQIISRNKIAAKYKEETL